jgi:hypothetical protein
MRAPCWCSRLIRIASSSSRLAALLGAMSHSAATLQTPDGHYVTPVNGGGIGENGNNTEPIHIDATTIGPYEQFSVGQALRHRATGTSYDPGRGPRMTDRRLTARAIPPSPGRTGDNDPPCPGAHRRQRPAQPRGAPTTTTGAFGNA